MPCANVACPCHGLACRVKIIRAVSECVMIDPCRSVSMSICVSPCQIQGWPFSPKKSACGKLDSSNRACQVQGWPFLPEKSACGKPASSNRACQIQGWSFSRKKSACGKIHSSNRACQSPDHGCIMGFEYHKVTFGTDRTPLHRIAVQF